jgi:hypothetical protein
MNTFTASRRPDLSLAALLVWAFLLQARLAAQSVTVTADPYSGETGVAPDRKVVFGFDYNMDWTATQVSFFNSTDPFNDLLVNPVWTSGYTVLTCTPVPSWPAGAMIAWTLDGVDILGEATAYEVGFFQTAGGGPSYHGTNAITEFSVNALHFYRQTNNTNPALDPDLGYTFGATTVLASNQTATAISVALPTSVVLPLSPNPFSQELYYTHDDTTNLTTFNTTYPGGNYTFTVIAPASNQVVTLNLPAPTLQPGVATVDNYGAAQSVNPTQPFTLNWSVSSNAPAADFILVEVGDFKTPDPGEAGALNGAARSVLIPAGRLALSTDYDATITLYRGTFATNSAYTSAAFRASLTSFDLKTTSGGAPTGPISFEQIAVQPNGDVTFDIVSSPGQNMILEGSATLLPGSWSPIATHSSPSGRLTITVTPTLANPVLFYRVQRLP